MDDIYFWVLRLWGALTSKKVLVALVGVAAVVVTVTTVFAAPLDSGESADNEDPDVFVSMEPPKTQGPIVRTFVTMDPLEELSIGGVDSPGILPTSPFFFVKGIARDVQYAFTFDTMEKADLKLRYANEDALAIRAMVIAGEYLEAAQECFSYQDEFFNSLAWAVKARKQGNDVETLMLNLMLAHDKHRLVLADALCNVDESQLEAVMGAITYTSAPFEQVIQWINGPDEAEDFHTKLRNDFSSVSADIWLQIENRLGLDVEQAVALSHAMGDSATVGTAPIISSVKAERTLDVEPSSTIVITCSAADLAGGSLTYQWLTSEGEVNGDGESVEWTAPDEPGLYTVSVIVSDERGNQSRKSISIRVGDVATAGEGQSQGALQTIELEVVPDGHTLLRAPAMGGSEWTVFTGRTVIITCVVDGDSSNVEYEWRCTRLERNPVALVETEGPAGTLSGDGQSVTWAAPTGQGYARVTVVACDSAGHEEVGSVMFRISTCATCFS